MTARHRVLLVGPWRAGSAGGGCCGGDPAGLVDHDHDVSPERTEAAAAADVVRALRHAVTPGVDVQLVDPRNTVYLVPSVFRDARRSGAGVVAALVEAMRATTPWALVIDGRVVSRSVPLTPDSGVAMFSQHARSAE